VVVAGEGIEEGKKLMPKILSDEDIKKLAESLVDSGKVPLGEMFGDKAIVYLTYVMREVNKSPDPDFNHTLAGNLVRALYDVGFNKNDHGLMSAINLAMAVHLMKAANIFYSLMEDLNMESLEAIQESFRKREEDENA
jgi:hypothetical protein